MLFIKKYKKYFFIFIYLLSIILILFDFFEKEFIFINKNSKHYSNKKKTIETLQNSTSAINSTPDTTINTDLFADFCKINLGSLKEACSNLTNKNCNKTPCCVVLNGEKCVAGSKNGPTFKTELGKNINIDFYYFQNKCYGDGCPSK